MGRTITHSYENNDCVNIRQIKNVNTRGQDHASTSNMD